MPANGCCPRLAGFIDAHPEIELRLDGTNEPTAFQKENVDIEIPTGRANGQGLWRKGWSRSAFCPSAPRLAAAGSLEAKDLPRFRLIHSVKSQVQWPYWFTRAGVTPTERLRRVLFDRSHMASTRRRAASHRAGKRSDDVGRAPGWTPGLPPWRPAAISRS